MVKLQFIPTPKALKIVYNDLAGTPEVGFFKARTIVRSSVREVKLSNDETYVEIVYTDSSKEQVTYEIFEDFADNASLYAYLSALIE